mgnify:CR=1 FL=1|tara:strand:- start:16 stop:243 length:228 start_codon:yes stop_codon:yes gene_type:complete
MEVNRNISSWGETSKKEVKVDNQIDDIEQILPIDNLNSYGDSCIPRGNNVFEFGDKNSQYKISQKTLWALQDLNL